MIGLSLLTWDNQSCFYSDVFVAISAIGILPLNRMDWSADRLNEAFFENFWRDKGIADSLVSDRGSLFTSKFWSELCFHLKIQR